MFGKDYKDLLVAAFNVVYVLVIVGAVSIYVGTCGGLYWLYENVDVSWSDDNLAP